MTSYQRPKHWNIKPQLTSAPRMWEGLSFFVYQFDDARPQEFFGTPISVLGTNYGRVTTERGQFGNFRTSVNSGECGVVWENKRTWDVGSNEITVFCLMKAETASTTDTFDNRYLWNGTAGNDNNVRCFLLNALAGATRWRTLTSSGGVNVDINATWSAGDFLLYVGTYDGSTARLYFYNLTTQTKQTNSAAQTGAIGVDGGTASLGNSEDASNPLPGGTEVRADIGFFGIATRSWAAKEVELLSNDPFAMLRPAGF